MNEISDLKNATSLLSSIQMNLSHKVHEDDEDEEDKAIVRQIAELQRRKAEKDKQKDVKKYISNARSLREQLIQEEEVNMKQNIKILQERKQELLKQLHIQDNLIVDEQ